MSNDTYNFNTSLSKNAIKCMNLCGENKRTT